MSEPIVMTRRYSLTNGVVFYSAVIGEWPIPEMVVEVRLKEEAEEGAVKNLKLVFTNTPRAVGEKPS